MASASPTIEPSYSPPITPTIAISFSTRATTFDLSLENAFNITVILTLHCSRPITFRKRWAPFFDDPTGDPGIVFTSIRTGEQQLGMKVTACFLISTGDNLPNETNRADWITLHPEQPHTLNATIEPIHGASRMRTMAELRSGSKERFTSLKWPCVHRLFDGETYAISVNENARLKKWMVGDLDSLLALRRSGSTPTIVEEVIEFEVMESTSFKVKRPDLDGSLNWP